jgi:hypothetical protein
MYLTLMEDVPTFHDGLLAGVNVHTKRAKLVLHRLNGEVWEVIVHGVQALRMDNFREGNIVYELKIFQGVTPPAGVLERLFDAPHPSAAKSYHEQYASFLGSRRHAIASGKNLLLAIDCSYGADLLAYGETVEVSRVGDGADAAINQPAAGERP